MRTNRFNGFLFVGVVAAVLSGGCSDQNGPHTWSAEYTYLFHDRSHSRLEHLYVVRDNKVAVQVAVFPGYTGPKWYACDNISDDLMEQVKVWAVRPGDLSPPFEPSGPWYCRITLTSKPGQPRGEAWYRNNNEAVERWFRMLQGAFVKEEYRVDKLPTWVLEDRTLTPYFGMWD